MSFFGFTTDTLPPPTAQPAHSADIDDRNDQTFADAAPPPSKRAETLKPPGLDVGLAGGEGMGDTAAMSRHLMESLLLSPKVPHAAAPQQHGQPSVNSFGWIGTGAQPNVPNPAAAQAGAPPGIWGIPPVGTGPGGGAGPPGMRPMAEMQTLQMMQSQFLAQQQQIKEMLLSLPSDQRAQFESLLHQGTGAAVEPPGGSAPSSNDTDNEEPESPPLTAEELRERKAKYDNLMTQRDKDYIVRILSIPLVEANRSPAEEYYSRALVEKERRDDKRGRSNQRKKGQDGRQQKMQIKSEYIPVQLGNTLGNIHSQSVFAPRRIIDVNGGDIAQDEDDGGDKKSKNRARNKLGKEMENRRRRLIGIEKAYDAVLEYEQAHRNKQGPKLQQIVERALLALGVDGDGAGFADVLTHQKGVELTARMIGLFPEIETSKIITALVVHADVVASKKHTKEVLLGLAQAASEYLKTASVEGGAETAIMQLYGNGQSSRARACLDSEFGLQLVGACLENIAAHGARESKNASIRTALKAMSALLLIDTEALAKHGDAFWDVASHTFPHADDKDIFRATLEAAGFPKARLVEIQ